MSCLSIFTTFHVYKTFWLEGGAASKVSRAKAEIRNLATAVETYRIDPRNKASPPRR